MKLISFIKNVFVKESETPLERIYHKGIKVNFKNLNKKDLKIYEGFDTTLSFEGVAVATGRVELSSLKANDEGVVVTEISDLEVKEGFTLKEDMNFEVTYNSMIYDPSTEKINYDIFMVIKNVQMLEGNVIIGREEDALTLAIGREKESVKINRIKSGFYSLLSKFNKQY